MTTTATSTSTAAAAASTTRLPHRYISLGSYCVVQ